MDSTSFDRWTRLFGASGSRRALGGGLLGAVVRLVGLHPEEAEAHNPLRACHKIKNKAQRAACVRKARAHNRTVHCVGVRCPAVPNGTLRCRRGKCVALTCTPGSGNCNGGVSDGCETNLQTDLVNCGRCGHACPGSVPGVQCVAGKCRLQQSFATPGGPYVFTAAFAGTLHIEAGGGAGGIGGNGGHDGPDGTSGGLGGVPGGGARVRTSVPVATGEQFEIRVGGRGDNGQYGSQGGAGGAGGVNGTRGADGAVGLSGTVGGGGGGGGGWSDVRRAGGALLVAAGAGGGSGGGGGGGDESGGTFPVSRTGGRGGNGGTSSNPNLGGAGGAGGDPGTADSNGQTGGRGSPGGGFPASATIEPGINFAGGSVLLTLDGP